MYEWRRIALNARRKLLLLASIAALAVTPGCSFINKLKAKDNLNEGVRDFNKGRYESARERFHRALELNPDNANAQLFYARAVNALFDQNLTEDLGTETLRAYQVIIDSNPDDTKAVDTALSFRARIFEQMAGIDNSRAEEYKQHQREALLARANLPIADSKAKAAVYYTIGQGYWAECYHGLSKRYLKMVPGKPQEQLPIPPDVQAKMRPLIKNAHLYLQKAIEEQADYANAWIYEKLVYMEELKIEANPAARKELEAKRDDAQEKYKKYLGAEQTPSA
jgi:tetratricopeptide (TPR) repeat protein